MGIKTGLAITAVGLAFTLHSYYKSKKEKDQQFSLQQQPPQPGSVQHSPSHSFLKPLAGALGLGAAASHYISSHQQQPSLPPPTEQIYVPPDDDSPAPPPQYGHRPTLRDPAAIYHHLCEACTQKQLQAFYPPGNPITLRRLADEIARTGTLEELANIWDLPDALALDLVRLALFDVILLVDDSASMLQGTSMREMRTLCSEVAWVASLFDTTGIDVRFFSSSDQGNNLRGQRQVEELLNRNRPFGTTPMGASLRDKILKPMTLRQARRNQLWKPQLVIIFTDGASTDASHDTPPRVIAKARSKLQQTRYGANCVFFSFVQVGQDRGATKYLSDLDEDPYIGGSIDVTSNTQFEVQQVLDTLKRDSRGIPPQWQPLLREELAPDSPVWTALFRVKRLVGAIHPWYDQTDESPKKRRRFSFGSAREPAFKQHWSENPEYIQSSTRSLQAFGYEPYPVPSSSEAYAVPLQPSKQSTAASHWSQPDLSYALSPMPSTSSLPPNGSTSSFNLSGAGGESNSYYSSFASTAPPQTTDFSSRRNRYTWADSSGYPQDYNRARYPYY